MKPMEDATRKDGLSGLPSGAARVGATFFRECRRLFFIVLLLAPKLLHAGDAYDAALDQRFAEAKGSTNEMRAAVTDPHLVALEHALKAEQLHRSQGPPAPPPVASMTWTALMAFGALILGALLVLVKLIQLFNEGIKKAEARSKEAALLALRDKTILEEPSMASFFYALRQGLETPAADTGGAIALSQKELGPQLSPEELARQLREFIASAPRQIAAMRTQLAKISKTPGNVRADLLRKFYRQLGTFKQNAGLPALRPVWLMLCGLEGLIHQLSKNTAEANTSVFRTVKGAIDVLELLCAPGLDPALATRVPVELLAVDDDSVCLTAVSMALRKAFRKPEVAADGLSALAMIEKKRYDVIFLDVEMPGMNGFELCAAIRRTDLNQNTPVVFVTSHGDFDSRAKSALVGGQELIAKPFHSFEITVKGLSLALRARLATDTAAFRTEVKEPLDLGANLILPHLPGSPFHPGDSDGRLWKTLAGGWNLFSSCAYCRRPVQLIEIIRSLQ